MNHRHFIPNMAVDVCSANLLRIVRHGIEEMVRLTRRIGAVPLATWLAT